MQKKPKPKPKPIPAHIVLIVGFILILIALYQIRENQPMNVNQLFEGEIQIVLALHTAKSPEERDRLITQLEALPIRIHPSYSRWLLVHDIRPFRCWSDAGYDPSQSEVPRDIQLLAATQYGLSDIGNGGYDQFYSNSTGVFAPEMLEWFERTGMKENAESMRRTIALFGTPFPRSQKARREFLDRLNKDATKPGRPFPIDKEGEMKISWDEERKIFDTNADQWLKEKFGITQLRQKWDDSKK